MPGQLGQVAGTGELLVVHVRHGVEVGDGDPPGHRAVVLDALREPRMLGDKAVLDRLAHGGRVQRLVEPQHGVDDQLVDRAVHVQPGRVDRSHA